MRRYFTLGTRPYGRKAAVTEPAEERDVAATRTRLRPGARGLRSGARRTSAPSSGTSWRPGIAHASAVRRRVEDAHRGLPRRAADLLESGRRHAARDAPR